MSSSTVPKSVQAAAVDGATGSSLQDARQHYRDFLERYKQLPDDFLRIPAQSCAQSTLDYGGEPTRPPLARETPLVDMIDISVVEAQLVKNYGLLRMDLYCKIRVGHMVCETQTCPNGAKNPKWDGVYQFALKPGIDTFHLEIYDEKQFSLDEKIAWLCEPIPAEIFQGITVERWFPLSGRLGPNKEGSVLLVLSHKRVPLRASSYARRNTGPPLVFVPTTGYSMMGGPSLMPINSGRLQPNAYIQPQVIHEAPAATDSAHLPAGQPTPVIPAAQQRHCTQQDLDQLCEMFPSIDRSIILAVLDNNHHDKEAAIGALLALG